MNNGISISGNTDGVVINGVRCGVVSNIACDIAKHMLRGEDSFTVEHPEPPLSEAELAIAMDAARKLKLYRAMRLRPADSRKRFAQFIVDAAQGVHENSEDTANAGPGPTVSEG